MTHAPSHIGVFSWFATLRRPFLPTKGFIVDRFPLIILIQNVTVFHYKLISHVYEITKNCLWCGRQQLQWRQLSAQPPPNIVGPTY